MASQNLDSVAEENPSNPTPSSPMKIVQTKTVPMDIPKFGKILVHIQGDLAEKEKRAVFLTVHDIGTNHSSFRDFTDHPCMQEFKARSIFIHLDLPGQEEDAPDFPDDYTFPTIQQMGEELIPTILDQLKVNHIVGIGEGAGANILARFSLAHQSRVIGMAMIHLVTAGVGMLEKLKDTFKSGKRRPSEAFNNPDQVIALHKFGGSTNTQIEDKLLSENKSRVANINTKNLRKYIEAYMNRKDISDKLSNFKKMDMILIAGTRSPYAQGVSNIYSKMEKSTTSLVKIDNVVDVLHEAPEKLAQVLLLFVQGLGYLTSFSLSSAERQRQLSTEGHPDAPANKAALGAIGRRRTLSMEEYDIPRPRRLSLTTTPAQTSPSK